MIKKRTRKRNLGRLDRDSMLSANNIQALRFYLNSTLCSFALQKDGSDILIILNGRLHSILLYVDMASLFVLSLCDVEKFRSNAREYVCRLISQLADRVREHSGRTLLTRDSIRAQAVVSIFKLMKSIPSRLPRRLSTEKSHRLNRSLINYPVIEHAWKILFA